MEMISRGPQKTLDGCREVGHSTSENYNDIVTRCRGLFPQSRVLTRADGANIVASSTAHILSRRSELDCDAQEASNLGCPDVDIEVQEIEPPDNKG